MSELPVYDQVVIQLTASLLAKGDSPADAVRKADEAAQLVFKLKREREARRAKYQQHAENIRRNA